MITNRILLLFILIFLYSWEKIVTSPHGDSNPRPSDYCETSVLKSLMLYRLSYEGWLILIMALFIFIY